MPSRNPQRVAIIGCGFFARNHILAWRDLIGAKLIAVCDLDPARAAAAANLAGGAVPYGDAAMMLAAEKPDVVDIVTTAPSHLSLARLCAEHGVPAIIQKPLAPSLSQAIEIANLARTRGVPMMVHENFRFQRPIRQIGHIVTSGVIGEPRYCRVDFRCGRDIFVDQPYLREDERLVLMDIGVHVLDVARFLMGEIATLSCRTQHIRPNVRGEDMATVLAGFTSGAMGLVGASWGSFLPDDPFPETLIEVNGRNGAIVLDRSWQISVRAGDTVERFDAEPVVPAWGERPWHVVQDSVIHTCRHWLDFAAGLSRLETSVEDNLHTLAAVESAYRSAAVNGALVQPGAVLAQMRTEDAASG